MGCSSGTVLTSACPTVTLCPVFGSLVTSAPRLTFTLKLPPRRLQVCVCVCACVHVCVRACVHVMFTLKLPPRRLQVHVCVCVCVCMCVCVCVRQLLVCACVCNFEDVTGMSVHAYLRKLQICMYMDVLESCRYVCRYLRKLEMCVCVCVCVRACVHVCMLVCMWLFGCCRYIFMCVCNFEEVTGVYVL